MGQVQSKGLDRVTDATMRCVNFEKLTVTSGAAVRLTAAKFNGASEAHIAVEDNTVRYRGDGTDPTALLGIPVYATQDFPYTADLDTVRFIAVAGDVILSVHYYVRA